MLLYARKSVVTRYGRNRDLAHKYMKKKFSSVIFLSPLILFFFFCFFENSYEANIFYVRNNNLKPGSVLNSFVIG